MMSELPPNSLFCCACTPALKGALGIKSDEIANYCFPKSWPSDRKQRAAIIGDWLKTEVRFLVS
jgi:hypothetical protein